MELRKGYYGDIDFSSVYLIVLQVFTVVSIIAALVVCLICAVRSNQNKNIETYNAEAAEFNARPELERKIIASYLAEGAVSGENYTMAMKDGIVDVKPYTIKAIIIATIVVLVITSATTSASYAMEKSRYYYLADLPFNHPYGWFLFFSMFIFWPILLISRIHMFSAKRVQLDKEKKAIEEVAQQELKDEADARRCYKSNFSGKAKRHYIRYRVKESVKIQEHRKSEIEKKIQEYEYELRSYGEIIRNTQRKIGSAKAELKELEKVDLSKGIAHQEALEEWRLISEMRGVSRITLLGSMLCILVKVRVPYKNHVYDFGDYEIFINVEKFSCKRIRSGVKFTATNTDPDYNEPGGFCFGGRRSLIDNYLQHARMLEAITLMIDCLQHARMLEAITLMIDCLHSVNSGVERYIPECFRRVETIETAKRRLKRRQKS